MADSILKLDQITKIYGNGVLANHNINLDIKKGEIHAIVGENGAGKSTLMKMIFGLEQPSSGDIFLKGEKVQIQNVNTAIKMGIGMVHQHFMLIPSFTVAQNVMLGMEPKKGMAIDYDMANEKVEAFAKKYHFKFNATDKVQELSVGMKQKVEIVKALIRGAEILILDEPTAVLTPQETQELFEQLKLLKKEGHTIIFISHKLKEVKAICDRVTIIRKGESKGVYNIKDVTIQQISSLMVGRDIVLHYDKKKQIATDEILSVNHVSTEPIEGKTALQNISFTVRKGTILGIAGVEGNGQNELIEVLTAGNKFYHGDILLNGSDIKTDTIGQMRQKGLSYIPEDRIKVGIAGSASIQDNLISNCYQSKAFNQGIFLNNKKIAALGQSLIEDYVIACRNGLQSVEQLSGGNIQKVVVARECHIEPELLIAEQPTRGVDLGAAEAIHLKMLEMRDANQGILLLSADISEAMEVSDALLVMFGGEIVAYIASPATISEQELGEYMLGIKRQSDEEIRRAVQ